MNLCIGGGITVSLWPSPKGERALLFVTGADTAPGMGFFPTEVSWLTLPDGWQKWVSLITGREETFAHALPTPQKRVAMHDRHRGKRSANNIGHRHQRKGDYAKANEWFLAALVFDPGHVTAWYNYACSLNRLGRSDRAMDVLRILEKWNCQECKAKLKKSQSDKDLAPLRSRADYKALKKSE